MVDWPYMIYDDFVPPRLMDRLFTSMEGLDYKLVEQVRDRHYSHVFESGMSTLPSENEAYMARFHAATGARSDALDEFHDRVVHLMKKNVPEATRFLRPVPYRLDKGDYFRT